MLIQIEVEFESSRSSDFLEILTMSLWPTLQHSMVANVQPYWQGIAGPISQRYFFWFSDTNRQPLRLSFSDVLQKHWK